MDGMGGKGGTDAVRCGDIIYYMHSHSAAALDFFLLNCLSFLFYFSGGGGGGGCLVKTERD